MTLRTHGGSRIGDLYYEEAGEGAAILLIHPAGSTASTWGAVVEQLAGLGRAISYDRRGYARSAGDPVHSISTHTADAVAILESLSAAPAVVVGTSAGAAIAVDLAVRHPELVRVVVAHEFPWRYTRHVPAASQVTALVKIGSYALARRNTKAVETLLRSAYSYRDGGSAWDAFPEEWRQAARQNAEAALADFRNSIGVYPSAKELATVPVPVVCSYGARSPRNMSRLVRALASAIPGARAHEIEGAGHAASFDATSNFVAMVAGTMRANVLSTRVTRVAAARRGSGAIGQRCGGGAVGGGAATLRGRRTDCGGQHGSSSNNPPRRDR